MVLTSANIFPQIGVRLQGSAAIPAGQLENHVDAGLGGNISFNLPVLFPGLELTLTTGYYYCGLKENLPGYDFNFKSVPLTAGFRYLIGEGNEITPYIGIEGGAFFTEYFLEVDYGLLGKPVEITREVTPGISPEAGFRIYIAPGLDIDVNARYNRIRTKYVSRAYIALQSGFRIKF
ncbi:MAG: hypothetical protein HBSAPP04_17790 [Ignavibacteriaceae bacterium]|nr:MAG: hypothetical protein EDM75_00250 [Chlorobiota bacterium]GJQ32940.1 MAG: hypothetical protein HBSAPP04_17790 [Ignavibacteriaceae bacterium]